jgi:hypothetical protein
MNRCKDRRNMRQFSWQVNSVTNAPEFFYQIYFFYSRYPSTFKPDFPFVIRVGGSATKRPVDQFTGTVRIGARWAAPGSARRMPMKVWRNTKARLLRVSVASM